MFITNDIKYVGVNDHEIDLFEGQFTVPNGMAYNSYVITDEKRRSWIPSTRDSPQNGSVISNPCSAVGSPITL